MECFAVYNNIFFRIVRDWTFTIITDMQITAINGHIELNIIHYTSIAKM